MTVAQRLLQNARQLAELLGAEIHPADERGYYRLVWPARPASLTPRTSGKPLNMLARLLSVACAPARVGGGGLTASEAGELCGLQTLPSLDDGVAGWERQILEAALPAELRAALRMNRNRKKRDDA